MHCPNCKSDKITFPEAIGFCKDCHNPVIAEENYFDIIEERDNLLIEFSLLQLAIKQNITKCYICKYKNEDNSLCDCCEFEFNETHFMESYEKDV